MGSNAGVIRNLDSNNFARWDKYVESKPEATFFHLSGWSEVLTRGLQHVSHYSYVEQNNEIVGILPIAEVKSFLFGHALISTPFCVYGGYVVDNDDVAKMLECHARDLAEKLSVDHLEMRNVNSMPGEWLSKELYVTFRKKMSSDSEENMKSIPRKQRAMVRKGIKENLQGEIDSDINRFFSAYSQSVRNLGTPVFPKKYFEVLLEVFTDKCNILTITQNNKLIASVLSFYFRDEVLPYYGGGTSDARRVKGNDFMYWELMRRSSEIGIRIFDFGRSKLGTGSYSFKKNWGFAAEPLHYQYHLVNAKSIPDINPMNPKYQMFIKIWRQLPLGVANVVGPYIARNLG